MDVKRGDSLSPGGVAAWAGAYIRPLSGSTNHNPKGHVSGLFGFSSTNTAKVEL
jgi:hypothetical protein